MPATAYLARFTPVTVESRRTRAGAAQLKSRGVIANKNGSIKRTVVAYGRLHDEILPKLEAGRPVLLKGYYERVRNADGSQGGEFFKPFAVIKVYDLPEITPANDTGRTPTPANDTGREQELHVRQGHKRMQRYGKGLAFVREIWIEACFVHQGGARKAA